MQVSVPNSGENAAEKSDKARTCVCFFRGAQRRPALLGSGEVPDLLHLRCQTFGDFLAILVLELADEHGTNRLRRRIGRHRVGEDPEEVADARREGAIGQRAEAVPDADAEGRC